MKFAKMQESWIRFWVQTQKSGPVEFEGWRLRLCILKLKQTWKTTNKRPPKYMLIKCGFSFKRFLPNGIEHTVQNQ